MIEAMILGLLFVGLVAGCSAGISLLQQYREQRAAVAVEAAAPLQVPFVQCAPRLRRYLRALARTRSHADAVAAWNGFGAPWPGVSLHRRLTGGAP